jgi:hypothetical protein
MAIATASPRWRRRRLWLIAGGVLVVLASVAAFAWLRPTTVSERPAPRPLAVVISGDTGGWIVPCGCTSNQSGGLLRRGQWLRDLRRAGDVLLADAGGAPGGTSAYQRLKFEAILQGELAMGLSAHNLGGPEAALGADALRELGQRLRVPFVSANLRDGQGALVAEPVRIIMVGGRRIAFTGVLGKRYAQSDQQIDEPRDAILRVATEQRGRYDALIVLAYLPEEELRRLAAGLPEADAVIGGPTGQSIAPKKVGPTLLAAATNKGKFLIRLEAAPLPARGWTGEVVEMNDQYQDDPEQAANVGRYLDRLAVQDFPAAETGFAPPLPAKLPEDYRLAGNDSCVKCHQNDCTSWASSRHAHAWETLATKKYHVDSYCQQCHTTGFGLPDGFVSAGRSPLLRGVGCESCHGPSLAHVHEPKVRTPFLAKDQCTRCHDRENSPKFDYDPFWLKIHHGPSAKSVTRQP